MNRRKEAALSALLDASTLTAAAEKAGIDRKTLYNYLHDDIDFAREYKRQRELRMIEQAEQAARERDTATQVIRDIMNDVEQPAAVRLKAAMQLIENANAGDRAQKEIAQGILETHSGFSIF